MDRADSNGWISAELRKELKKRKRFEVDMQKVRETASELQALGFNVHQALALVLMKKEWQSRIADECVTDSPSNADAIQPTVQTPRQRI